MIKNRTVPKGLIQDVQKGFRLLDNGQIIVDIPRDEYGFNRWRNVALPMRYRLVCFSSGEIWGSSVSFDGRSGMEAQRIGVWIFAGGLPGW